MWNRADFEAWKLWSDGRAPVAETFTGPPQRVAGVVKVEYEDGLALLRRGKQKENAAKIRF